MNEILYIIYQIIFYTVTIMFLYYTFLIIIGFLRFKKKYKMVEDKQKFCIFVPCHNEATVIGATVENLSKFTYNKILYDIYFIADNCSDDTVNEINNSIQKYQIPNFYVLERNINNPKKKGKPHAINWAINKLEEENCFYEKYNFAMILDADNFADSNILENVNSQYLSYKEKKRPVMIQTYLDSKNKNNLIARGYYVAYRCSNGFWQLSKHMIGLNPGICGTGFAITTKFLKQLGGFICTSLTEDLEIQTIATLKGKRTAFNPYVRIYDEKPTGLNQSIVQKTRWAQGHWYVFFKYVPRLFISLFNFKQINYFFRKIDVIFTLLAMFNYISVIILLLFRTYFTFSDISFYVSPVFDYMILIAAILSYLIIPISSLYDGKADEKKNILKDFIPNIIAFFIGTFTFVCSACIGLFKCGNQKVWKKTAHKVTAMKEQHSKKLQKSKVLQNIDDLEEPIEILKTSHK